MKSVIDRYGKAKEEQQVAANPNSELKVCSNNLNLQCIISQYMHPKVFTYYARDNTIRFEIAINQNILRLLSVGVSFLINELQHNIFYDMIKNL
jgi:hypothetical protein